jgi:hypothetical protein
MHQCDLVGTDSKGATLGVMALWKVSSVASFHLIVKLQNYLFIFWGNLENTFVGTRGPRV